MSEHWNIHHKQMMSDALMLPAWKASTPGDIDVPVRTTACDQRTMWKRIQARMAAPPVSEKEGNTNERSTAEGNSHE